MPKGDIITNNQNQSGSGGFGKGIVTRKLSCRSLVSDLKVLIDRVTDPSFQHQAPVAWAQNYGLLLNLLHTQDINRQYVRINLGKKRCALIEQIISNVKEQIEKGSLDRKKA